MGRQIVEDDPDAFGRRVVLIDQIAHALGEVDTRAVVGDCGVAPGAIHIDKHEDVRGAVGHVLVVDPSGPGLGRNRDTRFADQLPGGFIEADDRSLRIRRRRVEIKDVFHARHVLATVDVPTPTVRAIKSSVEWASAARRI
jgi:hypothetical protein